MIELLIGLVSTVVSSTLTWLFARRKYNSEVDNNLIENMLKSLDFYMKLSDDNKQRLEEALKRNDFLETEIQQLRTQVFELMNNICYDMSCELRKKLPKKASKTKKENNTIECKEND